jgi:hypothetical protein
METAKAQKKCASRSTFLLTVHRECRTALLVSSAPIFHYALYHKKGQNLYGGRAFGNY